ncbi:hypothetical protein RI367_001310 [Sorochytrium milnesiophthora]
MSTERVVLYVYDLSQGMARLMSRNLTGRQIDGIWHTSVVVYGREWYFGQGVFNSAPGVTHYGRPVEQIEMGQTSIPKDVYREFLNDIRPRYTAAHYHLLNHNCNTFSNEVCQFLVGKTIPGHITGLPADFLNTPFGQMLRPTIDAFFSSAHGATEVGTTATAQATVNPTHAHFSLALPTLRHLVSAPTQSAGVNDKMYGKLEETIKTHHGDNTQLAAFPSKLRELLGADDGRRAAAAVAVQLLKATPDIARDWIFLDVARCAALNEHAAGRLVPEVMAKCTEIETANPPVAAAAVLRTALNTVTNLTSHPSIGQAMVRNEPVQDGPAGTRAVVSALLILGLLHGEQSVRVAAGNVVVNLARAQMRLVDAHRRGTGGLGVWDVQGEQEEWVVEVLSACVNCLQREGDVEQDQVVLRLVAAIGCFLYTAPPSVLELVQVLELKSVLASKTVALGHAQQYRHLCAEIDLLLSSTA